MPPPGYLPNRGIETASLKSPAVGGWFFTTSTTWEAPNTSSFLQFSVTPASRLTPSLYVMGKTVCSHCAIWTSACQPWPPLVAPQSPQPHPSSVTKSSGSQCTKLSSSSRKVLEKETLWGSLVEPRFADIGPDFKASILSALSTYSSQDWNLVLGPSLHHPHPKSNRDKSHQLDPPAGGPAHRLRTRNRQLRWEQLPKLGNISSDKIRFDLRDCSKHQLNRLWCSESHQIAHSSLFLALKSVSSSEKWKRSVFCWESLKLSPWRCGNRLADVASVSCIR